MPVLHHLFVPPTLSSWDGRRAEVYTLRFLSSMRHMLHPKDERDAFWLIHPDAWRQIRHSISSDGRWPETPEDLPATPTRRTVVDDPNPPERLLGLPLYVRDDGQDPMQVQIWAENDLERAVRRNPDHRFVVADFPLDSLPPCTPPTMRALLGHWRARVARALRRQG